MRSRSESAHIARRYDALRAKLPCVPRPDRFVISRGIAALPPEEVADIVERVRTYDEFSEDNDPWGEHDFGAFDHGGKEVFWKAFSHGGHGGIRFVLCVMYASEY